MLSRQHHTKGPAVTRPAPSASLLLSLFVCVAACGGNPGAATHPPAGGRAAALEDVPTHALAAPADAYGSVILHDDQPYLFVALERGLERVLAAGLPIEEACQEPPNPEGPCPHRYDATAALIESAPAAPPSVQVLTPEGACEASVGELTVLVTGNCLVSFTLARPLTGCAGPLSPVARVSGFWDADLRYHPTPPLENVSLTDTGAPRFADAGHAARVRAWMSEPEVAGRPLQQGIASYARLDAGGDVLETSAAGFLVGSPEEECEQEVVQRMSSFLRRGDALTPVADLPEWSGALTWRGRVVGVVSGLPHYTRLASVSTAGALRQEFEQHVWSDNDECAQFGWALIEYPCGP